ncbi:MAG: DUF1090 domain-containing protein [Enterobacter sp.]|jgi:ankyrin repeat protein|nr:DUF1090 domain-containing protein [Enterobacter sp.]
MFIINNKVLISVLFLSSTALSAHAETYTRPVACAAKINEIQTQIDFAKKYGNQNRVMGLETALSETSKNCTEESLRAQRENKIREKEIKLNQRRGELEEAQAAGRTDKIVQKQEKLEKAKAELAEAKASLD